MSTLELKEILKSKIDKIDNEHFLSEINDILNNESDFVVSLTDDQKISIKKGQSDYLKGNYFSNDLINEEIEQLLKEKKFGPKMQNLS